MTAGAVRGNNDTNDPTWSLYFAGVRGGIRSQPALWVSQCVHGNGGRGLEGVAVSGDATKLDPEFAQQATALRQHREKTITFQSRPGAAAEITAASDMRHVPLICNVISIARTVTIATAESISAAGR
jgi:hypothetical protein